MGPKEQRASWRWTAAGRPLAVELDGAVVDRLHAEAMRGYSLIPKRGAEIGGILLGTVLPGATETVLVEDFEEVPCDYTEGPVYVLNGLDRNRFRQRLLEVGRSSEAAWKPVGYFRSNTGDNIEFTPEDTKLMDECFPDDLHVALIIKPSAFSGTTAQVFVRENGAFDRRPNDAVAAFRSRDARSFPPPDRHRALTPEHEPVPEPIAEIVPAIDVPRRNTRTLAWYCLVLALIVLGAAIARQVETMRRQSVTPPDPYAVGLRLERTGDALLIDWNRSAPAVQAASRGTVTITDGDVTRAVSLDSRQLRAGTLLYRHVTPELRFRFELHLTSDRSVIETASWHDAPPY